MDPLRSTQPTNRSNRQPQPEDNWELVGNPSVYLDQLPQPYRFINKCLQKMILAPVFNKITAIEEIRKTSEYEGNVKEAIATGHIDTNGITHIHRIENVVKNGGIVEKANEESHSRHSAFQRLLMGDKLGQVHILDSQRKLVLGKLQLENFKGRRIQSISTATLEWVDSRLCYAAVSASGSPFIEILTFKVSENKLRHMFTLNTCP
jgi:hypothetical protein